MDGIKHVLGIWVQGRGRSLVVGARVRRVGQPGYHGRADRVLRRTRRPARGDLGDLAQLPGPGPASCI